VVAEVDRLVADISVVTLWLCLRPRKLQSLPSRSEPLLDSNSLSRELLMKQLIVRTVHLRKKRQLQLQLQLKVLVRVLVAEAVDMVEVKAWLSMDEVVQLSVVAATSNSLPCKLPPMLELPAKAMIFRDEEAPLDITDNRRETLRVTGETSLKAKLHLRINKVPWVTSRVNSSRVVSNPVTAIADP
jgi:hypothetical protein